MNKSSIVPVSVDVSLRLLTVIDIDENENHSDMEGLPDKFQQSERPVLPKCPHRGKYTITMAPPGGV